MTFSHRALDPTLAACADAIRSHADTRNAVAEITTSLIVLGLGIVLFRARMISLAGPMAQMRAHGAAVRDFALGDTLGRAWYWAFPVELSPRPSSPQRRPGTRQVAGDHLRGADRGPGPAVDRHPSAAPVARLMTQLDTGTEAVAPRHLLARTGGLVDTLSVLWRSLR